MSIFSRNSSPKKNAPLQKAKPVREGRQMPELRLGRTLQSILDGSILTREQMIRLLPFIFYIVFLAIIFIANTYYAERLVRRIDNGNKELKDLQIEYIDSRAKLMNQGRQSLIEEQLGSTGLRESSVPPYKIRIENED
jgi:hypothetical protein